MQVRRGWWIVLGIVVLMCLGGCSKKAASPETLAGSPISETKQSVAPASETDSSTKSPAFELQLKDAFFDYDKATLTAEARETLAGNAQYLMNNASTRVLIEGHCDERGTREYNLALGDRRARAVMDFLVDYGISPTRIEIISYGKERPFVMGSNESAWAQNRRAHFVNR
ncbi:MAG: peptidoglycan-associated lipoprotein Pal [Candidatus Eisenbacteria bacterium]|nr:peptidoglycan-associated lipoprotein Pal [Candidatus Eisenbacteria bacterium]